MTADATDATYETAGEPPRPRSVPPGVAARRLPPWMPLVVVALAWLAQGRVLGNGWVWDDVPVVREDRNVARGVAGIPALFGRNWYADLDDVGFYRPVVGATLALEASLHGTQDAFGFHLTNLFLHGLVAVALLAVGTRLAPNRPVVVSATAILFAIHPLHTGTVSWIVARGDLLAALFSLLAALAWLSPRTRTSSSAAAAALEPAPPPSLRWPSVLGAAACLLLALLSKEMAASVPLALFVLDAVRSREGPLRVLRSRGWAYLVLLVPIAAWFALRVQATGSFGSAPGMAALEGRGLPERLVVGAFGLVRTAWNLAVPAGLSGDRSDDPLFEAQASMPGSYAWFAAGVLVATAIAVVRLLRRRAGVPAVAWTLFVVLSLPVLQVVPLGVVHEDRFAYLPSLALLAIGGAAVEALLASRARPLAWAACGMAAASLVAASWRVAGDWRDERRFDESLLDRNPQHRPALNRLGRWYLEEGKARLAAAAAERVVDPQAPRPTLDAAHAALTEAVRLLERAASLAGTRQGARIWRNLGDARYQLRDYPRAVIAYKTAITKKRVRLDGRSVPYQQATEEQIEAGRVAPADTRFLGSTWFNLGRSHATMGESEEAVEPLRQAALWSPEVGEYQHHAGNALQQAGKPLEALKFLRRAERTLRGREADEARQAADAVERRLRELSEQYFAQGAAASARVEGQRDALRAFEDAIAVRPNYVSARIEAAKLHAWQGNFRAALAHLDAAEASIEDEPSSPNAPTYRSDIAALRRKIADDLSSEK